MSKLNSTKLSLKESNLFQRIVSGVIGSGVIMLSAYYSEWSFFGIFLFISVASQYEFYNLVKKEVAAPNIFMGMVIGILNFVLLFQTVRHGGEMKWFILNFPLLTLVFISELYTRKTNPFTNISFTILGVLYISIPFSLLVVSAFSQGTYSWEIVIGILLLIWTSDTGAYIAGRTFGRRKLFERVSPKKTWEGSLGGFILSFSTSLVLANYFPVLHMVQWMVLSIITVVIGTYGDLIESMFKRSISQKDSGTVIPGHGGFLDRFDSLVVSLPFIAAYLMLF